METLVINDDVLLTAFQRKANKFENGLAAICVESVRCKFLTRLDRTGHNVDRIETGAGKRPQKKRCSG